MKPIAFFFTQWIDYGRLIEDQSKRETPNVVYQPKRKR